MDINKLNFYFQVKMVNLAIIMILITSRQFFHTPSHQRYRTNITIQIRILYSILKNKNVGFFAKFSDSEKLLMIECVSFFIYKLICYAFT